MFIKLNEDEAADKSRAKTAQVLVSHSFFLYLYSTCVPNQIGYYTTQMHQLPAIQGDIVRDKGTRILPRAQLKDGRRNELQDKRWKFSQQHSLTRLKIHTELRRTGQTILSILPILSALSRHSLPQSNLRTYLRTY